MTTLAREILHTDRHRLVMRAGAHGAGLLAKEFAAFYFGSFLFRWLRRSAASATPPFISESFMLRGLAAALVLSCLATVAWAQAQPAQSPAPAKAAPKKPAAARPASADTGPCRIGVVSAIGDRFGVQKIGLTVFGNEDFDVAIDTWGLDDLVVARVRAVAGPGVKRITYAKNRFESYYNSTQLFRDPADELTAIVREITASAGCERYLVLTKLTADRTYAAVSVIQLVKQWNATNLFVRITYTVFDGETYEIRRNPSLVTLESVLSNMFSKKPTRGSSREIDSSSYPNDAASVSNSTVLRDGTRALLVEALDDRLPKLLGLDRN